MTREREVYSAAPLIFLGRSDVSPRNPEAVCLDYLCGGIYRNVDEEKP
jgi:hypothetical protein